MRINSLKINGYGKIKNKEIQLDNKINVIYGENEAGKSTTLRFIFNMLYGASKNKKGKDASDYDRFKPWNTEEFSGKMKYTLEEQGEFEVYRKFKKKSPKIFNSKMEEISGEFKENGASFFEEQTGIDEESFINTAMLGQEETKLTDVGQANIVQKMGNQIQTGRENISFKKAMEKINKAQLERVGNNKSLQKPLNIVKEQIFNLEKEKENSKKVESLDSLRVNNEEIENEIEKEEMKIEALKKYRKEAEENKIKNARIEFNQKLKEEYDEKIREIEKKRKGDKSAKKISILSIAILIICALLITFTTLAIVYKTNIYSRNSRSIFNSRNNFNNYKKYKEKKKK